jgi:hypothetical protein
VAPKGNQGKAKNKTFIYEKLLERLHKHLELLHVKQHADVAKITHEWQTKKKLDDALPTP